jgi:predicted transcriptional regulator
MANPGPTVTPVEVIDWTIRHTLGQSLRTIAKDTGRTTKTVREHLIDAGAYEPPPPGRHIDDDARQAIVTSWSTIGTIAGVARALHHTRTTVMHVLQAAGRLPATGGKPGRPRKAATRGEAPC